MMNSYSGTELTKRNYCRIKLILDFIQWQVSSAKNQHRFSLTALILEVISGNFSGLGTYKPGCIQRCWIIQNLWQWWNVYGELLEFFFKEMSGSYRYFIFICTCLSWCNSILMSKFLIIVTGTGRAVNIPT